VALIITAIQKEVHEMAVQRRYLTISAQAGKESAFTLIELLIVVAIIAILAAIAVPNFLEAQVRSKVSRVKSDFRSVIMACEAYRVDCNYYPNCFFGGNGGWIQPPVLRLIPLTTPIAYITSVPNIDILKKMTGTPVDWQTDYEYYNYDNFIKAGSDYDDGWNWALANTMNAPGCWIESRGPSGMRWVEAKWSGRYTWDQAMCEYDPTNGTKSFGSIRRFSSGGGNRRAVTADGRLFP
jgi:prepilin-type N-terminal cleavage/methylation domain-containing protein